MQSEALPADIFVSPRTKRFSIALFEAVFTAVGRPAVDQEQVISGPLDPERIRRLDADPAFIQASEKASADKVNVQTRLSRATEILT